MKILIMKEIIGPILQTRKSASALVELVNKDCTLDFTDVTFMSRAFADELCSILDQSKNISLINMNSLIGTLFEIVKEGRKVPRQNLSSGSEVLTFNDMDSLKAYLSLIQ